MYIEKLTIENLRSFANAELELNTPRPPTADLMFPNVNVMLGGNGLGKTSILRSAALAVLGPLLSRSSGYLPESMVRRPPSKARSRLLDKLPPAQVSAEVLLDPQDRLGRKSPLLGAELKMITKIRGIRTSERLDWDCVPAHAAARVEETLYDERGVAFFMVGYGAGRRVEASSRVDESARLKSRLRRYERVASLFEDHVTLIPLSYWLPAYAASNKGRYSQVVRLMNDLLPAACRMETTAQETSAGREHLFHMNGVTLPFRALSDGYRAYIGWIGDMLYHVCMGAGTGVRLRDVAGVVLLDEVDLHLHPEWQRVVVPTIAKALPNVQFIVTTHSALVVGSLQSSNLFVLNEVGGATRVQRLPEPVHGKSAEQILLSPYFGLESTRAPEVSEALSELASRATAGDREAAARYLELLSGGSASEDGQKIVAEASATPGSRPTKKASDRGDA